jgi:hypothetical protein
MAHQTPIVRWMLDNRDRVKPSFIQYDWPSRYLNGLSDFSTTISIGGIQSIGRGVDADRELALEKSAAEAVERYICQALQMDSEGFAVSGDPDANAHAKRETLERYYFRQHRVKRLPFMSMNASLVLPQGIVEEFENRNGDSGELSLSKMASSSPFQGFVAILHFEGKPICLGISLNHDSQRAANSAFNEAMINFARFRDDPIRFEEERLANSDCWNCDPRILSEIDSLSQAAEINVASIAAPQLVPVNLDISQVEDLHDCPITPVKFTAREIEP